MPSASRNANRKRRQRRNITLLTRGLRAEALDKTKALIHLMSVLAQKGGEVTVTKGTIDQVIHDLKKLSYSVDKGEAENEFIFRLQVATEMPEASKEVDVPLPLEPSHIGDAGE